MGLSAFHASAQQQTTKCAMPVISSRAGVEWRAAKFGANGNQRVVEQTTLFEMYGSSPAGSFGRLAAAFGR